jgi:hypothetical protein
MGKRLHVAKHYEVEFGNTEAFNYSHDKFYDLLGALGGEPNYVCGDVDCPSDIFECTVGDYNDAVQNLEVYISDPDLLDESDDIKEHLDALKLTAEEVLKIMKSYQQEADTRDGYLHFMSY